MKKLFISIAIMLLPFILSGCPVTVLLSSMPGKVNLAYIPEPNVKPLARSKNIAVHVAVSDLRKHKKVGNKRIFPSDIVMAAIYSKQNVAYVFKTALEKELKAKGFKTGSGSNANVNVLADITYFYNNYGIGFMLQSAVAKIAFSVNVVNKEGKIIYSNSYIAHGKLSGAGVIIGSSVDAGIALNKALKKGIKKLFSDRNFINSLLSAKQ